MVNGTEVETRARNLAELVEDMRLGDVRVATALNGKFVPMSARCSTALSSGDRIEVLSARQGG